MNALIVVYVIPECPEDAIFADTEKKIVEKTGKDMEYWVELNGRLAEKWEDNCITDKKDPLKSIQNGKQTDRRKDRLLR